MEQNNFLQEYFENYLVFISAKNTLNILVTLLDLFVEN